MIVKTKNAGEDRHRQMVIADAAAAGALSEDIVLSPKFL
jgi:hypothetical protein